MISANVILSIYGFGYWYGVGTKEFHFSQNSHDYANRTSRGSSMFAYI